MLVHSQFFFIFSNHIFEVLKLFLFVLREGFVIVELTIVLDLKLNLLIVYDLVVEFQRFDAMVSYGLLLRHNDILEVTNDFFLYL